MHMRAEHQTLVGRDHIAFRSYYYPVKVSNINDLGLDVFSIERSDYKVDHLFLPSAIIVRE